MFAIEMNDVTFRYSDGTCAISKITLNLEQNRKLVLLGANGSGKTTLLLHLNGLLLPQTGDVSIFDIPVTKKNLSVIRQKAGILFDNPDNQLFSTSVAEDIAFGPFNMNCSPEEIKRRTDNAMNEMNISELAEKPPCNLSWGQKKKAAIAGLLSMDIDLFVLDEPFSGLDPDAISEFLDILDELYKKGKTLVISTHDVDMAYSWADDVIILNEGQIRAVGGYELLRDDHLMKEAKLRRPALVEIFDGIGKYPRNLEQAMKTIDQMNSDFNNRQRKI